MSREVLTWGTSLSGGSVLPLANKKRAYELLQRAEHFICSQQATEADLADGLGNLRRAVTQRVQLLERIYGLRRPLKGGGRKHFLELLAEVRIVRATLLHALLEARNAVEYRDRKPPSRRRCQELADAVWYFLKSTDSIVVVRRNDLHLEPCESSPYGISLEVDYSSHFRIKMHGWLPEALGSRAEFPNSLATSVTKLKKAGSGWPIETAHSDKAENDWWFIGALRVDVPTTREILTIVFDAE